jgi:hypothetical protein
MIENSTEIKQDNSHITELGEVFFKGKHENIKLMDEYGLPIPDTCILGMGFDESKVEEWIDNHSEEDITIRTSVSGQARGSLSFRDPSKSELNLNNLRNLVKLDQAVILQALPIGSIDHDCMSGICRLSNDKGPYFKNWKIVAHPDIASLSNRIGLSPFWNIELKDSDILEINKHLGTRQILLDAIRYRVGRSLLKKEGTKLPNLETVEYKSELWQEGIQYCKDHIQELPEDHVLVLLEKEIEQKGLENLMPNMKDLKILIEQYPKFLEIAKELDKSQENRYPFSFGVKFSILEYEGREKQLLCWDLIHGA